MRARGAVDAGHPGGGLARIADATASRSCTTPRPRLRGARACRRPGTDLAMSSIVVPIVGGDRVLGVDRAGEPRARARLRRIRSAPAADRRRQHGRGARERAPVRRDAAAAQGDRAAQRRARGHQQHPAGHGREARLPGDRRPRRRQAARGASASATSASAGSTERPTCCTSCTSSSTACGSSRRQLPVVDRSGTVRHAWSRRASRRRGTPRRDDRARMQTVPGTDGSESRSSVVPILGGDRVLGVIVAREPRARTRVRRSRSAPAADRRRQHGRRARERAPLRRDAAPHARDRGARRGRPRPSSTLDLPTVMDRIAHHAKDLLHADNSAIFLPEADSYDLSRDRRGRRHRRRSIKATVVEAGAGIIGSLIASGSAEFVNDTAATRAACRSRAPTGTRRAADGGAAAGGRARSKARWRCGAPAATVRRRELAVPGGPVAPGHGRAARTRGCSTRRSEALERQTATADILQRDQQLGRRRAAGVRRDPGELPATCCGGDRDVRSARRRRRQLSPSARRGRTHRDAVEPRPLPDAAAQRHRGARSAAARSSCIADVANDHESTRRMRDVARDARRTRRSRCAAAARRPAASARSTWCAAGPAPSTTASSRCCRPSPTRRSSRSRTRGCSTRRRKRSSGRPPPPRSWRRSAARWPTPNRCSMRSLASCERLFAARSRARCWRGDDGQSRLGAFHGARRARCLEDYPRPLDDRHQVGRVRSSRGEVVADRRRGNPSRADRVTA